MTLVAGSAADANVPVLGASGAIAAVLGAYWVLYPDARILTLLGVFFVRVRAWIFLGLWFLYQFVAANSGLLAASSDDGGTAFFAHVGGFVFGVIAATALARSGQRQDQGAARPSAQAGGGCQQPDLPGAGDRLRAGVRVELGVDVAQVRADRVRGDEQLGRDLGRLQVARQVSDDAQLRVAERLPQRRGVAARARRRAGEDVDDLGEQRCVGGAVAAGVARAARRRGTAGTAG